MERSRVCLVCSDRSDGSHFGVDTCRACAAFFRRSIVLRKRYICRQGMRDCHIDKSVRCMCRACRFLKCIHVGMKRETVQSAHDSSVRGERRGEPLAIDCTAYSEDVYNEYYNNCISHANSSSPENDSASHMPFLSRIQRGYAVLKQRRLLYSAPTPAPRAPIAVSMRECNRVVALDHPNVQQFALKYCPRVDELPVDQQMILFNSCYSSFLMLETVAAAVLAFPGRTDRVVTPDGNYIDIANLSSFFDADNTMTTEEAIRTFLPSFEIMVNTLMKPMQTLHISEIEVCALLGLIVTRVGLEGATEATNQICQEVQDQIFRELLHFYADVVPESRDRSVRLARLTALLPGLQRVVTRHWEDLMISRIFSSSYNETLLQIFQSSKPDGTP